jgi:hypothetical protein
MAGPVSRKPWLLWNLYWDYGCYKIGMGKPEKSGQSYNDSILSDPPDCLGKILWVVRLEDFL